MHVIARTRHTASANCKPFEVHPTKPGHVQMHVIDGYNGYESIADLAPSQIDSLIAKLNAARNQ